MAKINPKAQENVESYKGQKAFDRVVPVKGVYDVVDIKMGWQKVGKKGTEKARIITHVLKVVECDAKDKVGAEAMVGKTFSQDIWWNLFVDGDQSKGLNFNGKRLVNAAIAHGCSEEFDPDDRDEIVKIICDGTPYRIKFDVNARDAGEKTYYDVNVSETKYLVKEAREKYRNHPDFAKIMPPKEDRRMEDADYSTGGGEGESTGGGATRGRRGARGDEDTAQTQGGDVFRANDAEDDNGALPF